MTDFTKLRSLSNFEKFLFKMWFEILAVLNALIGLVLFEYAWSATSIHRT